MRVVPSNRCASVSQPVVRYRDQLSTEGLVSVDDFRDEKIPRIGLWRLVKVYLHQPSIPEGYLPIGKILVRSQANPSLHAKALRIMGQPRTSFGTSDAIRTINNGSESFDGTAGGADTDIQEV